MLMVLVLYYQWLLIRLNQLFQKSGLSGLYAGVSHGMNKALNKKKILEIDEKTMNQIKENLKKINDFKVFDRKVTLNQ